MTRVLTERLAGVFEDDPLGREKRRQHLERFRRLPFGRVDPFDGHDLIRPRENFPSPAVSGPPADENCRFSGRIAG